MRSDNLDISNELHSVLGKAVDTEKLPHAVLLEGGDTAHRLSLALFLANCCVCSGDGERPCGICPDCIKSNAGFHPDISVLKCGEDKNAHKVEAIREICEQAYIMPNEAQRRVFVINNSHLMNDFAQNALLKTLEEPPGSVCFILTCDSRFSLLRTVVSRCTVFSLPAKGEDEDSPAFSVAKALAHALPAQNELELMQATAVFEKDYSLLRPALAHFTELLRRSVVLRSGVPGYNDECVVLLSGSFSTSQLLRVSDCVQTISDATDKNANQSLNITRLCSLLRGAVNK